MGKQVQVKPGYTLVWLYPGGVFDEGELAVLRDVEYEALGIHQNTVTVLGTVPDPPPPAGPGSLTVQDENSVVAEGVTQIDFQGAGVTTTATDGEVVVNITSGGGEAVTEVYDQASAPAPPGHPYLRVQRDGSGDIQTVYFGTGT